MPLRDHEARHGLHPNELLDHFTPDMDDAARQTALEEALAQTSSEQRRLINAKRRSIVTYTEEGEIANSGDVGLSLAPYSNNLILVNTIMLQGPIGAGATWSWTLQLGQRMFIFTKLAQFVFLQNLHFTLTPTDVRKLSWVGAAGAALPAAGAGDAFLWILGEELPEVNF